MHKLRFSACFCLASAASKTFFNGLLGDADFVTEMQKKIGREKEDLNIPRQQKRLIAKPLSEIAAQLQDRKTAIIAAYKTGAYNQREIGEFYQLHPTPVGVILRKSKNS